LGRVSFFPQIDDLIDRYQILTVNPQFLYKIQFYKSLFANKTDVKSRPGGMGREVGVSVLFIFFFIYNFYFAIRLQIFVCNLFLTKRVSV
jgi:hypothetical protein